MNGIKTAGIIAEFNPFHNGHELLIKKVRDAGFSHIAVVMSGNFTQRGEPALMLKSARARAALLCGADLVLELPTPFAVSSAEKFAYGAAGILNALGCVDSLCFGSECGDIELLKHCAEKLNEADTAGELSDELKRGVSYPKARANVLARANVPRNDIAAVLDNPNDTLAVEYIKALKNLDSSITPFAVKRMGARHDGAPSLYGDTPISSASALRSIITAGNVWRAKKYMPSRAFMVLAEEIANLRAPFQVPLAEPLILAKLRTMSADDFIRITDVSEGLENRIYKASRMACSLNELYFAIKSKRYTLARIRRIVLRAFLDIDSSYTRSGPPYIRVLGFNNRGRELLKAAKKSAALPIISRFADAAKLSPEARRFYDLECKATDLYMLCVPKIQPCGFEQKFTAINLSS